MDSVLTRSAVATGTLEVRWLGQVPYRRAWAEQHALVAARAAGEVPDQLLLLEHPPVLTLGRQSDPAFVRIPPVELARRDMELIRTERGGEVTYHGPGQLVAYPIVRLADRHLMVRPFVRLLEAALRDTCATLGVEADRRDGFPGCWVDGDGGAPRKIGALGVRVERGVTYHGIALNVTVDLAAFDLIEACGLPGVTVTSIARELGRPEEAPSTASVRQAADAFGEAFQRLLPDVGG
jgi:lipoyl(octanoyl) transferase